MGYETHWHKQLKAKARKWLESKGYSDISEEVQFKHCRIDIVGIDPDNLQGIGIECGTLNIPIGRLKLLPITILHMALRNGLYPEDYPHRLGGCPYCSVVVRQYQDGKGVNA